MPWVPYRDDTSELTFLCLTLDFTQTCTTVIGWGERLVERTSFSQVLILERPLVIVWYIITANCVLQPPGLYSCIENGKYPETFSFAFYVQNNLSFITTEFTATFGTSKIRISVDFSSNFTAVPGICAQRPEDNQKSNRCFTLNPLYWPPRGQQVSSRCPDVLQNLKTKTPVIYDHQNDKYIGEDRTRNMIPRPIHVVVKPGFCK